MVYIKPSIASLLKIVSAINKHGIDYSADMLNILKHLIK